MNNQNNRDAFEQFLLDETDKHQMFASDAAWANISKQVQKEKSWPALTIVAFLIVIGLSVTTFLNYPPDNILAKAHYNDSVQLAHQKEEAAIIASMAKDDDLESRISSQKITAKTFAAIAKHQQAAALAAIVPTEPVVEIQAKPSVIMTDKVRRPLAVKENGLTSTGLSFTKDENLPLITMPAKDEVTTAPNAEADKSDNKSDNNASKADMTDDVYKDYFATLLKMKTTRKSARWTYDIYATPSKSYRNLEDDKVRDQYTTTSIPNAISNSSTTTLSNAVKHKPALGLEAGIAVGYNLTPRLVIKAGLQFNIRQYYIDAYQTYGIATIAIIQNNRLDSLTFYSRFGSAGSSYSETKLDNRLYQLSLPLGVEWAAFDGKKLGVSVGASVQPTFTLNKSVYLISTDYKYYANGESFFRKWNMNTALNLNLTYKINGAKIYIGPQVRYQHLPTYNDAYPIKEYRLDYGVKIGFIQGL
ncbi:outer membrane beta-barrel protein [Parasediminibacterium paludis]|uniref:Outer membrane beta-barrel protein n=1 Tax=Parasediminibacterium paludis TaxID=908966 RepID=A0ABV8PV89_9BACT